MADAENMDIGFGSQAREIEELRGGVERLTQEVERKNESLEFVGGNFESLSKENFLLKGNSEKFVE